MATKKTQRDRLPEDELAQFRDVSTILRPGDPYLFLMGFGWGKIGFYVKHVSPTVIMVAHCNHFRNAGKDYGRITMEGLGPEAEWRYEGELVEISTHHIMQKTPYHGKVNRSKVLLSGD